ncbi:MAG: SDR family NAD(P)-dependent oxidoreductase [Candidatus Marinamargulisbacteria bacterium]
MEQAIVFGGSGGVGAALINELLQRYPHCHILVPLRYSSSLQLVDDRVKQVHWDPDDDNSLAEIIASHSSQPFDLCLSAIGALHQPNIMPEKKLGQLDIDHMVWSYKVNAITHAMIIKHVAKHMSKASPAKMGFLTARVGSIGDNKLGGWYSYRAAKAALNMILRTAAIEMKRYNKTLTIFGIHPGTVDTALSEPFQNHVPEHKLFTPAQSAKYIFDNIIDQVSVDDSGYVFAWDGEKIPE